MSVNPPVVIDAQNLSIAWGRALLHAYDSTNNTRSPLLLCVSGFPKELPPEDAAIRSALDRALAQHKKNTVRVSGMVIFPYDMWLRRGRPPCDDYCTFCVARVLPRLKKLNRLNRHGTYFERMMAFTGARNGKVTTAHQLSFVIGLLKNSQRWPRESALQLACFDPAKDHTGAPVRGFPCLQQVSISHDHGSRFALNAHYPTQYVFDRGYGNYVGLCHLGAFIAHETNLTFSRLNCFVGDPQLGDVTKTHLRQLVEFVRPRVRANGDEGTRHGA
jgi:hypothetical protein